MSQSRGASLLEACLNTATGFVVSMLVWQFLVAPLFDLPVSWAMNLGITAIFTVTSILRSYLWRRTFNWFSER